MSINSIDGKEIIEVDWAFCDFLDTSDISIVSDTSIPSGTTAIFCQGTAPTGWTKITSNDYDGATISIKGDAGALTDNSSNPNKFKNHIHGIDNHTHTYLHYHKDIFESEFLIHSHDYNIQYALYTKSGTTRVSQNLYLYDAMISQKDSKESNTTTTSAATPNTSSVNFRYHQVILATKI